MGSAICKTTSRKNVVVQKFSEDISGSLGISYFGRVVIQVLFIYFYTLLSGAFLKCDAVTSCQYKCQILFARSKHRFASRSRLIGRNVRIGIPGAVSSTGREMGKWHYRGLDTPGIRERPAHCLITVAPGLINERPRM